MARKIEQLLNVIADLHRFNGSNFEFSSNAADCSELSESDLDLIAAAANTSLDQDGLDDDQFKIHL